MRLKIIFIFVLLFFGAAVLCYRFFPNISQQLVKKRSSQKFVTPLEFNNKLKNIFRNSYFDLVTDHNQLLDVLSALIEEKKIGSSPKTLIQVDYHSDMYRDNIHLESGYESVGNWVNVLISKGIIDEIYWVLPDTSLKDDQKKIFWDNANSYSDGLFRDGPKDQLIYVDNNTNKIYFYPISSNSIRQVRFHKRLLSTLPSFRKTKKQIILSIDADFFDYNGFQSEIAFKEVNKSEADLNQKIDIFVSQIYDLGIRPILTVCSKSSDYVGKYGKIIDNFFRLIEVEVKKSFFTKPEYKHNASWRGSLISGHK